jgi:hypothetical protein
MFLLVSCNSERDIQVIEGVVAVDGAPVAIGTIHLRAMDQPQSRGLGGVIANGEFSLSKTQGISSGKYVVTIEASQSTGRMVKDQQKGEVAEIKPVRLPTPTKEIEITSANASSLQLNFTANGT